MKKWGLLCVVVVGIFAGTFYLLRVRAPELSVPTDTPNVAIVVPHHDMAKQDRLALWQTLKGLDGINRVYVISPNHFGTNQKIIYTSDVPMSTNSGMLGVVALPGATVDNNIAKTDHGVFNLIGEVKHYTPNATLTAIFVGTDSDVTSVTSSLVESCPNNCLIIASVDFTHYEPADVVKTQDTETLKYLEGMDIESRPKTDIVWADSPKTLEIIQNFAKSNSFKWHLFKADYSPQTSHILGEYRL